MSRGLGSGRRGGLRRIVDYLGDNHTEASDNESFITAHSDDFLASTSAVAGGGMLPAFLADQSDLVEVMLELDEESIVVRSVMPAAGVVLAGGEMHTPGSGRSLSRSPSTSSRLRRTFAWLRSPSPLPVPSAPAPEQRLEAAMAARERRRVQARMNRSRSGARRALKGLRFISCATDSAEATALWGSVEERFNALSHDGLLARDDFGDCVGMVDSKEFAVGIFDALARRRRQNLERVTKDELYDFWLQIFDQSFDARLQIFFDMVDTNVDGRITREEVQEVSRESFPRLIASSPAEYLPAWPPLRRASTQLPSPLGHLAGFNAFWYSHHLLVVVYLLLLVHGWFIFLVSKWHQRTQVGRKEQHKEENYTQVLLHHDVAGEEQDVPMTRRRCTFP